MKAKDGMKICSDCKRNLPVSEFSTSKYEADGLNHKCRECSKAYAKESYLKSKRKSEDRELIKKLLRILEPIRNGSITTEELKELREKKYRDERKSNMQTL